MLVVAEQVKPEESVGILVGVVQHHGQDVCKGIPPCMRDKDSSLANVQSAVWLRPQQLQVRASGLSGQGFHNLLTNFLRAQTLDDILVLLSKLA